MVTPFKFILTLCFISEIYTEENIYFNNGWIPISNEKALGFIHRNYIKEPEIALTDSWNPVHQTTENEENFKDNNKIKPYYINNNLVKGIYYDAVETDLNENDRYTDLRHESDKNDKINIDVDNKNHNTDPGNHRKSKKIAEDILNDNIIDIDKNEMDTTIKDNVKIKRHKTEDEHSNNYEVTEASEASEIEDYLYDVPSNKNNDIPSQSGYELTSSTTEENLTSKLFKVLGNYNIRTNDDLTNYAQSRNKQGPNFPKQGYASPISLKHNSPNYFPIDPLLAVFLSNYGYYLSGLYGFPGNYHNIYGYLAANNIHNNKPFGAYKIYSDTDSSH